MESGLVGSNLFHAQRDHANPTYRVDETGRHVCRQCSREMAAEALAELWRAQLDEVPALPFV